MYTQRSYLLATAFLLKYGLRMMRFSQLALPRVLRRRLLLLCSICSAVFLLHALYYLATAAQVELAGAGPRSSSLSGGYPPAWLLPGGSTLLFDALFYPVMELLPSAAILFALHHKRRSYLTDASVVVPYSVSVYVGMDACMYVWGSTKRLFRAGDQLYLYLPLIDDTEN